eukprot:6474338-Amphidinium_carterae.1
MEIQIGRRLDKPPPHTPNMISWSHWLVREGEYTKMCEVDELWELRNDFHESNRLQETSSSDTI